MNGLAPAIAGEDRRPGPGLRVRGGVAPAPSRIDVAVSEFADLARVCADGADAGRASGATATVAARVVNEHVPVVPAGIRDGTVFGAGDELMLRLAMTRAQSAAAAATVATATATTALDVLGIRLRQAAQWYAAAEHAATVAWDGVIRGTTLAYAGTAGLLAGFWPHRSAFIGTTTRVPDRPAPQGLGDLVGLLEPGPCPDPCAGPGGSEPGRVDVVGVPETRGATPSYVIVLPGTSSMASPWCAGELADIRGMQPNLQLVAGQPTAELAVLPAALARAGVPAGARLVLVGHSQGGLTAYRAAADPIMRRLFRVEHVVTAGAPVGRLPPPPGVAVVSLEHRGDLVPLLDLQANAPSPDHVTVRFGAARTTWSPSAHAVREYVAGAAHFESSADPAARHTRERLARLGIRPGTPRSARVTRVVLTLPVTVYPLGLCPPARPPPVATTSGSLDPPWWRDRLCHAVTINADACPWRSTDAHPIHRSGCSHARVADAWARQLLGRVGIDRRGPVHGGGDRSCFGLRQRGCSWKSGGGRF